jgi:hypothetical protein
VLAVRGRRLGRDPLEHADHVHFVLIRDLVSLPIAGPTGAVLPQNADFERRRMRRMVVAIEVVAVVQKLVVMRSGHCLLNSRFSDGIAKISKGEITKVNLRFVPDFFALSFFRVIAITVL